MPKRRQHHDVALWSFHRLLAHPAGIRILALNPRLRSQACAASTVFPRSAKEVVRDCQIVDRCGGDRSCPRDRGSIGFVERLEARIFLNAALKSPISVSSRGFGSFTRTIDLNAHFHDSELSPGNCSVVISNDEGRISR